MLIFTIVAFDTKEISSNLIITYPAPRTAGTLLPLGVEAAHDSWSDVFALLPRTRSIVLFVPPNEQLDEEVLNPLLIRLRQLQIMPEEIQRTICAPTKQGLPWSQQQMIQVLTNRRLLKPHIFGLAIEDGSDLVVANREACPNFWHMARGEFGRIFTLE